MKSKYLGQVFTPETLVNETLDDVNFTIKNIDISKMKILEPSFGDGAFLKEIVRRMAIAAITYTRKNYYHKTPQQLIDENLYGIELDKDLFENTVNNIKYFLYDVFGLEVTLPNLVCGDALDTEWDNFNYIVGNPPYIRIHNIDKEYREKVKNFNYSFGTTDLYVIFFEEFKLRLSDEGRLTFVTPNSWMRNASQKVFRNDVINSEWLEKVRDFGTEQVFPGFGTYVSVTTLSKGSKRSVEFVLPSERVEVAYEDLKALKGARIAFNGTNIIQPSQSTLSLVCKAVNGVCTLGDKLFLITEDEIQKLKLETTYILDAVKGSKYKGDKKFEKMFFPYKKVDNRWVGISEEEFSSEAPNLYNFMLTRRDLLEKRSRDKKSLWFWYGRSQAIQNIDKRKLMISPIIHPKDNTVQWFEIPPMTVIYSGLFIMPDNSIVDEKSLVELLESEDFCSYARSSGRSWSGGYKMISSKILNDFDVSDVFEAPKPETTLF